MTTAGINYHRCPAPKCIHAVQNRVVFCKRCWAMVDPEIQERISAAWDPLDKYAPAFTAAILDAVRLLKQDSEPKQGQFPGQTEDEVQ